MMNMKGRVWFLLTFVLASVGFLGYSFGPESVKSGSKFTELLAFALPLLQPPEDPNQPWIEQVSWEPRIFLYHNILTPEECREIIELGSPDLTESQVVAANGKCVLSRPRSLPSILLHLPFILLPSTLLPSLS